MATAIDIYPQRIEAYNLLIDYYKNHDATEDNVKKIGNTIEANASSLDTTRPEFAELYYDMGKLYFAQFGDSSLKSAAVNAKPFFEIAVSAEASYDKKSSNKMTTYTSKQMTIDTKIEVPTYTINGVAKNEIGGAYKGEATIGFNFADQNFDTKTIKLTRTRFDKVEDVTDTFIKVNDNDKGGSGIRTGYEKTTYRLLFSTVSGTQVSLIN